MRNMLLAFVLIAITLLVLTYIHVSYWRLYQLANKFPGPPTLPLIGNAHLFVGVPPESIVKQSFDFAKKYGKTFRFWLGSKVNIVMQELQDIEIVLGSMQLITKSEEYKQFSMWLGDGLLLSSGRKWSQRRKLITPAFHFKILEEFTSIFQRQSAMLVAQLAKRQEVRYNEPLDLTILMGLCTLDIICESAMGVTVNAQTDADSEYVRAIQSISSVTSKRMSDLLYYFDLTYMFTKLAREGKQALSVLHGFTERIIVQRRAELLKSVAAGSAKSLEPTPLVDDLGIKRKMAFLDILLQSEVDGKPLNNLDIREEVDTFMFEGHDTTTTALTFLCYNLALNPECQSKCYAEIIEVFGSAEIESLNCELLSKLHYLELCIKESLRLYPPVPIMGRKVLKEIDINGKRLPAGAGIGISALGLGRDETIFPDPLTFKPERFDITMRTEQLSPYAFIPFSAGPRNCIGQKFAVLELKSVMAYLLHSFELQYAGDPNEPPVLIAEIILKSKTPLLFKLKPRLYNESKKLKC